MPVNGNFYIFNPLTLMMILFQKYKALLLYSAALALLLILLRWAEWELVIVDNRFEVYAGLIALLFTLLGIWLAVKLSKPKTILVEKEVLIREQAAFKINEKAVSELGISKRELEILVLTAGGLSNQQIADQLFVSLNTIKTHLANMAFVSNKNLLPFITHLLLNF